MKSFYKSILIASAAILLKNIYFFISEPEAGGVWGINRTLDWLWQIVFESYAAAFLLICLFLSLIAAIRREKRIAFYFIAVSLFIFPFHSLYFSYRRILDQLFGWPMASTPSITEDKLNWIVTHLSFICYLVFTFIFLVTAFISARLKKSAMLAYEIILGIFLLSFVYINITERTFWEVMNEKGESSFKLILYAKAIIFSSLIIWLITVMNFLRNRSEKERLFDCLFYISVPMLIIFCLLFYWLLPEKYLVGTRLMIAAAQLICILLIFIYRKYSTMLITVIIPIIPLLIGAALIALFACNSVYRNYMPSLQTIIGDSSGTLIRSLMLIAVPFAFLLISGRTSSQMQE